MCNFLVAKWSSPPPFQASCRQQNEDRDEMQHLWGFFFHHYHKFEKSLFFKMTWTQKPHMNPTTNNKGTFMPKRGQWLRQNESETEQMYTINNGFQNKMWWLCVLLLQVIIISIAKLHIMDLTAELQNCGCTLQIT